MVKTLILHIGWRKTGSSAIQDFVSRNTRDHALQDIGVIPAGHAWQSRVIGARPTAHHGLARFAHKRRCKQAWERVAPFVAAGRFDEFLITSEVFPSQLVRADEHYEQLSRYTAIFERIRILCWMRRQDEYIASLSVQAAKHGGKGRERGDPPPATWPKDADYCTVLDRIAAAMPRAEIVARYYAGPTSDVVDDFIEHLGLDATALDRCLPPRINARVPPEAYRVQIELNRRAKARGMNTGPLQKILLAGAQKGDIFSAYTTPAIAFTHEDRKRIMDRYRESNRRLCASYGLDEAQFELSPAEINRIPEFNIPDRVSARFSELLIGGLNGIRNAENTETIAFIRGCLGEISDGAFPARRAGSIRPQ